MTAAAPHLDINCVEIRALSVGLRQAWRLRVEPGHLGRFRSRISAIGLHLAVSRKRYADVSGGKLSVGPDGLHLVVVASREAIAVECLRLEEENTNRTRNDPAMLADLLGAHRLLGATYGYPDCCVDAFCDAHAQAVVAPGGVSDNAWIIARAAARSKTFHPLLRAFGNAAYEETASPLRHLPCRFDCPASVELAGALIRELERSNPPLCTRYRNASVADLEVDATGSVRPATQTADGQASDPLDARSGFPVPLPFRSRRYAAATD